MFYEILNSACLIHRDNLIISNGKVNLRLDVLSTLRGELMRLLMLQRLAIPHFAKLKGLRFQNNKKLKYHVPKQLMQVELQEDAQFVQGHQNNN